jgi:hypothetical protein
MICLTTSAMAYLGVHLASEGEDRIEWMRLLAASYIGGMPFAIIPELGLHFEISEVLSVLAATFLGAALMVAALVDRDSGWAPDILVLPILCMCMPLAHYLGVWDFGSLFGEKFWVFSYILYGFLVWLLINGVWLLGYFIWKACDRNRGYAVTPPGDIIAAMLPFFLFGTTDSFFYTMFTVLLLMLLLRNSSTLHAVFTAPELHAKVLRELDVDVINSEKPKGVAFLAVLFPVMWAVFLLLFIGGSLS